MSSTRRSLRRSTLAPILENENYVPRNNAGRSMARPVNFSVRRKRKQKKAKGTQKYGRRNKLVHPPPIQYNNNNSFEALARQIAALGNNH
jgi:hypothetical protein